jgi:two-component system, NtrC family, sensor kinase
MAELRRRLRTRLETKVMVAVVVVLVALPVIMLWTVDRRLREQMQRDADVGLSTARSSFEQSLRIRSDALTARFGSGIAFDQRFLTILGELKGDPPTLEAYLRDFLNDYPDTDLALFVNAEGALTAKTRRTGAPAVAFDPFADASQGLIRAALEGKSATDNVVAGGNVFNVVAVPVTPRGRNVVGALVFGSRIGDAALRKIRPPDSEILLIAANTLVASTLGQPAENDGVLRQLAASAASGGEATVRVSGRRYKPATGTLIAGDAGQHVRYVLLSSVEQQLQGFEQTRTTLIGLSALGILAGAGIVWFFVRRITRPLVELRDSAEAVGRGDFSHRIVRISNDECGDLAEEFNRMTASLQSSRAELERAMQQVRTTQEQLIQSEKLSAVGQFVAGVAHELNNPLTAVVGFAELLQATNTDEKAKTHLDRIAKSAHRCHKIVHSLLSFARQHPPERKPGNLQAAIEEVLEIMAYEFRTSDVTIVRDFAPDLPPIMADLHQLQQVFVNILSNARQAMEGVQREGRITIRTRHTGKSVTVEIQDNGPGIKPEHLARIFDPFFTTKPVGKGTGLGLSLCYGIVQEHGGTITARSEPGQGATFAIELPVAEAAAMPSALRGAEPAAAAAKPMRAGSNGRSVLVIDDEQWILELAVELLRAEGYDVSSATGGQQALELIGRRTFDVIVSDWKMPGLNGIRLYEHLLATDRPAARRVLFMTGDVVSDTFQEFLRRNELTCLSKPFAAGEFRAAVAKVFGDAKA